MEFENQWVKIIDKMFPNTGTGEDGVSATAIPYYYSIVGDLLINPSTVSISTFQRMIYTDDNIGNSLEYLSSTIESRIGEYCHADKEIEEFGRRMLKVKLRGGKRQLIKFMNSRHWAGFFMGEKKYEFDKEENNWYITEVIPVPPATIQVRVDGTGHVRNDGGVLQFQFNFLPGVTNTFSYFGPGYPNAVNFFNSSATDSNFMNYAGYLDPLASTGDADFPVRTFLVPPYMPKAINYDKFLHIVYDIGDGFYNPYGRSLLRRVYNLYILKYAIWQLFLIALDRRATPLIVGYADGQKSLYHVNDLNKEHPIDPVSALNALSQDVHSTSFLTVPSKKGETYEIVAISSDADLTIFTEVLDLVDKRIRQSLFIPGSVDGGDSGASYALGMQQGSFYDRLIKGRTEEVTDCLIMQILKPCIDLNFGKRQHKEDYGYFDYKALSLEEQIKLSKIVEGLTEGNWISSQNLKDLNKVRDLMDFDKVAKAFKPLVTDLEGEAAPQKVNQRDAKDAYSNWSQDKGV